MSEAEKPKLEPGSGKSPGDAGAASQGGGGADRAYELEPVPEARPVAKISDKPFLDEFDEDADFDDDAGKPQASGLPRIAPVEDDAVAEPPFIKPGRGDVQAMMVAGLAAMLVAATVNAIVGPVEWYKSLLLSLYHSALFATAGVVAIVFAARMTQKPLGEIELAAARMLLIVSVCQAIFAPEYPIPATGRVDEVVFTALAYFGLTGFFFRLPKEPWLIFSGAHFLMMVLLWVGANIEIWAAPAAAVLKK